ncbi:golgin subfamily A member 6-like protein 1 [Sipha flava]|uniref:Golgin subfamily A member 6-like protein 1 n=1 Tax=Sipha flava TaxID=143950 RepID=A0A8B8GH23_9HEMI|nr:golgin subfamily A member 6-like protein 1 [Sipha flava]
MIYGGKPLIPVAPDKKCNTQKMVIRGPGAYSYGLIAKQPGSDYKIRIRDKERIRLQNHKMQIENLLQGIHNHDLSIEMINVADKKHLYNRIKGMVDEEMKTNEHLFVEERPNQKLVEEDEEKPKLLRMSKEEIQAILDESKIKKDEEERKTAEEKRLQHFIENSSELRIAAITKRQKEISDMNYKIIQEKEMMEKEQKLKKLEQLKNAERKDLIKLTEKLNKEKEFEILERIKHQKQNEKEIAQFLEERAKLFSKSDKCGSILNDTFVTTTREHIAREKLKACKAKMQLRHDNEWLMKRDAMIKEERRKQNEEMSNILMKQIKDIEDLKVSVEREKDELRRKRVEEDNRILMEQLKFNEEMVKHQNDMKRKALEESMKDHENYLKEEKELCQSIKQRKWNFKTELSNQINSNKDILEKQKMTELENHRKHMKELAEQEELLQKLLKQI